MHGLFWVMITFIIVFSLRVLCKNIYRCVRATEIQLTSNPFTHSLWYTSFDYFYFYHMPMLTTLFHCLLICNSHVEYAPVVRSDVGILSAHTFLSGKHLTWLQKFLTFDVTARC